MVNRFSGLAVGVAACALGVWSASAALGAPPETPKIPVTDEHHGVKLIDDYRWLEDWNDEKVKKWSETQNEYTRSVLDKIKCVPALRERATQIENAVGVEYHTFKFVGGKYFAVKRQPPKQQPMIVVLKSLNDASDEKVIVDPNVMDSTGGTSFDWFVPSPDGSMLAVSVSSGGSESGDVHIFKTDSGELLKGDIVPRVNGGTAGGGLAWAGDSKGFYYTRYPRAGERPGADMDFYTQLYFHTLGEDTAKDRYETGKDYPKIAEIAVEVSHDGKWVLTNVQNGDGGEFIQDVRSPDGKWTRISRWEDRIVEAKFGHDSAMYLASRKDAPRGKLLRLALKADEHPDLVGAETVIAEAKEGSIETDFSGRGGLWLTKSRVYVLYQTGGPNELRVFGSDGKSIGHVPSMDISTINDIEPLDGDDIVFQNESFVSPATYFRLEAGEGNTVGEVKKTAFSVAPPPGMPALAVVRDFAPSKDGTKVPINIIGKKSVVDAVTSGSLKNVPTIVYGYGGYGVNLTPAFARRRLLWTEQGGLFVVANIRGGGEYGEAWHLNGNLTKKQNVFDDFLGSCRYMLDKGYTTSDKLAIMGGSNGGLLMGAAFTQQPSMFKAVLSSVGIYDMLRVELSANGEFNITEFGTVKNPEHFKAMHAYSPYHNVKDGTKYPAILFMTGANDPRVDPMQSRKMTARLQAAQKDHGGGTVLLRTSGNTGHGMGTPLSAQIEQAVDTYAFLMDQLGVDYQPVKADAAK